MGQGSSQDQTPDEQGGAAAMATGGGPRLYSVKLGEHQWPIVYKDSYNIGFMGLEKIHPFDAGKWGRIHKRLVSESVLFIIDCRCVCVCVCVCACVCARVLCCVCTCMRACMCVCYIREFCIINR